MSCARSWCTWLLTDIENPFPSDLEPFEDVHSALQQAWLGHSILVFKDLRERMKVQLDLCLAGGILVRSVNAVSYTHLDVYKRQILTLHAPLIISHRGGDPNSTDTYNYIPGASVRGAVAQALGDPGRCV